jgi:hypothetical protein
MSTVVHSGMITDNSEYPLMEGQRVLTVDNTVLGRIKEVNDTHFKVDVRFRRDYWLPRHLVAFVDERSVGLTFRSDETELYKLHRPMFDLNDTATEYKPSTEHERRWENGPYPQ